MPAPDGGCCASLDDPCTRLLGLLSTDVIDNGPATTLEQVMLTSEAKEAAGRSGARVYGVYNAIASLAGAVGALAAGLPAKAGVPASSSWGLRDLDSPRPPDRGLARYSLEPSRRGPRRPARPQPVHRRVGASRPQVRRLATLFAVDAGGGGLATASFLAYCLTVRYNPGSPRRPASRHQYSRPAEPGKKTRLPCHIEGRRAHSA